jgi:type I restriction enzyme S subunit
MVPNGWEVKSLEDVVSKTRKITYGIVVPGPNIPEGNLMIRAQDYSFGWKNIQTIYRVSDKVHKAYKRSQVKEGDVLLTIVGSIGKTAIVPKALEDANLTQQTARLFFEQNDGGFFHAVMNSSIGKREVYRFAKSGVQPSLNLSDIAKFKVPVPPLPEQRKIAKILSTWDKAISTTERLIDNSKQQKKALMQQLLTGKKRLLDDSGKLFEGEWKDVTLGEISYITTGSSNREDSFLDAEFTFFDRSEDIRTSSRYLFDAEAVIVAGEGQDFVPKYFEGKFDLHQRTYAIMKFRQSYGKFLFYYIGYYRHYFLSQAVGSTVKSLRLPMFQKMPIKLPNELEQQKIAAVLSNSDSEIKLLKQQLVDLKQEKKALMQQLLTGKRRVKVDEKEVA